MPMPADCSASANILFRVEGIGGNFSPVLRCFGRGNVGRGHGSIGSGWSFNPAAISIVPDTAGDDHPSSLA